MDAITAGFSLRPTPAHRSSPDIDIDHVDETVTVSFLVDAVQALSAVTTHPITATTHLIAISAHPIDITAVASMQLEPPDQQPVGGSEGTFTLLFTSGSTGDISTPPPSYPLSYPPSLSRWLTMIPLSHH